jgi:hypothetical protein
MRSCPICEGETFVPIDYKAPTFRAPALECASCRAILLDEDAARSDRERHSVRLAAKVRAGLSSGTYPRVTTRVDTPVFLAAGDRRRGLS